MWVEGVAGSVANPPRRCVGLFVIPPVHIQDSEVFFPSIYCWCAPATLCLAANPSRGDNLSGRFYILRRCRCVHVGIEGGWLAGLVEVNAADLCIHVRSLSFALALADEAGWL